MINTINATTAVDWCCSTLMVLPLVNADDETKAIADNKIAVVLIVFHMSVWLFLVVLVVVTFCHYDSC